MKGHAKVLIGAHLELQELELLQQVSASTLKTLQNARKAFFSAHGLLATHVNNIKDHKRIIKEGT